MGARVEQTRDHPECNQDDEAGSRAAYGDRRSTSAKGTERKRSGKPAGCPGSWMDALRALRLRDVSAGRLLRARMLITARLPRSGRNQHKIPGAAAPGQRAGPA